MNLFHKKYIYIYALRLCLKVIFSCFKQLPSNFTVASIPLKIIPGIRLLSDVAGLIPTSKKFLKILTL